MKLSFLGMKKLMAWASNDIKGDLKDLEFEQKDFDGCFQNGKGQITLTVEEAKAVLECVDACAFPSPFEGFISKNILLRDKLKKRIEKTEVQDEIK